MLSTESQPCSYPYSLLFFGHYPSWLQCNTKILKSVFLNMKKGTKWSFAGTLLSSLSMFGEIFTPIMLTKFMPIKNISTCEEEKICIMQLLDLLNPDAIYIYIYIRKQCSVSNLILLWSLSVFTVFKTQVLQTYYQTTYFFILICLIRTLFAYKIRLLKHFFELLFNTSDLNHIFTLLHLCNPWFSKKSTGFPWKSRAVKL